MTNLYSRSECCGADLICISQFMNVEEKLVTKYECSECGREYVYKRKP